MSSQKNATPVPSLSSETRDHIHPESIAGLSYNTGTVRGAAQSIQREKVSNYLTLLLPVCMSMYEEYNTPLPPELANLILEK